MNTITRNIEIPNKINELQTVEKFVENVAEEINLPVNIKYQIDVILDELVTNIISYGYDDKDDHIIKLIITYKDDLMTMELEDDGIHFNPLELPPPDITIPLEERPIGGLGIHIVKNLVRNIDYKRENNKNRLVMEIDIKDKSDE